MGDRVIDLLTVGGVGDDFAFEDVEVVIGVRTGDQQPLIGVEGSHLFDAEDGGLHRRMLVIGWFNSSAAIAQMPSLLRGYQRKAGQSRVHSPGEIVKKAPTTSAEAGIVF
jgi:hypothetical protein